MFLFKSCARCRGDMRLETDPMGHAFIHCLNCGHSIDLPESEMDRANEGAQDAGSMKRAS